MAATHLHRCLKISGEMDELPRSFLNPLLPDRREEPFRRPVV